MLALLLLAAGPQATAVDAENAFRRAAQAEGQWTAFRKFAEDDAIVFTPKPEKAQVALPKKDPPVAVQWWPAQSYVSCDGALAVNTGPWVRPRGGGYFTTVWRKQADGGWKWALDHGDALAKPRALPARPAVRRAACTGRARFEGAFIEGMSGGGASADRTLNWYWELKPNGGRMVRVRLWNGRAYDEVIRDEVAGSPE